MPRTMSSQGAGDTRADYASVATSARSRPLAATPTRPLAAARQGFTSTGIANGVGERGAADVATGDSGVVPT